MGAFLSLLLVEWPRNYIRPGGKHRRPLRKATHLLLKMQAYLSTTVLLNKFSELRLLIHQ